MMFRNLFWMIGFVLLVFLGDRIGGFFLKKLIENSQFRYSRLYNKKAESDILLLGNSRGLSFYQPYIEEITNQATFNLSYNALPIDVAKVLVEDYLKIYEHPELVIIDITICDRINKQLMAQFACYQPFSEQLSQLIQDSISEVTVASSISHLYQYNSEIFQRALFYYNKSDEAWLLDRDIAKNLIDKVMNESYRYHIRYPQKAPAVLAELTDLLQQKGIKVKLVVNPYYPPFRKRMTDLDSLVQEVENLTKLKVHDYSKAIKHDSAFGDLQHLNKRGSKLYLDLLYKDRILGN